MGEGGQALRAIGRGGGDNRGVGDDHEAIASPVLETDITGARKVLFNVTSSGELGLKELNLAAKVIQEMVDPDAEIIFGTATNPSLGDQIKLTVIATGFLAKSSRDEEVPVSTATDRWSAELLDEIGLEGEDVELPAFLRKRRVAVQ